MAGKAGILLQGLICLAVLAGSISLMALAPDPQRTSSEGAQWVYLRLAFPVPQKHLAAPAGAGRQDLLEQQ